MKRLISLPLIGVISCASVQVAKPASFQDEIKLAYEKGEKAFSEKLYEEAVKQFEEVRSKYPYSKYAVLSDLRLGDVYFEQEKWLEAADSYDFYLRFHPRHEKNAYAWFRIAKSYVNAIPKEFFFLPKSYVKDQTATHEALEALARYVEQYPTDEFIEEAKKMKSDLRTQLALRDMSIAEYYLRRGKVKGAKARYEHVAKSFADTPEGAKAAAKLENL